MDEQSFKQRLVGAIVLVALAVIFIPMLLPGQGDNIFKDADDVIPQKPREVENITVLELDNSVEAPEPRSTRRTPVDRHTPRDKTETVKTPKPAEKKPPAEAKAETTAKTEAEPKARVGNQPKAWAVQVGSFSKRSNAIRLRDKLRAKQYLAFVEKIETNNKLVYRVRVGPEIQRKQAEKTLKDIQKKMKIKGLVVSHP